MSIYVYLPKEYERTRVMRVRVHTFFYKEYEYIIIFMEYEYVHAFMEYEYVHAYKEYVVIYWI